MNNPKGNILVLEDTSTPINEASYFINKLNRKNYTPFGMQFNKINATQLTNYNKNFSIEIPIIGNILHRAFFEIILPILSFNDSLITDTNYIVYKNNNLNNIMNEITKWQDTYDTMYSFSNIMIEVYVDVKKILKLQNITLSYIQSRVLTIINKYGDNLYRYRLLIEPDILNNTDIASYIINLTTLNNILVIDTMYDNNINYLNYYMGNITYYTKKYNTTKEGKILCKWIDNLGHYYFNYFELVVNGITIDNYSNDYLHISQTQNILAENLDNYNSMIGNTESIYYNKGSPNIIYTPLIFSFNKDPSQSLPLVGMMNSSIKINSMVGDLKNLVYLQDWKAMYNDILNVYIRRDQHTIDSMNGVIMKDLPYTDIELLLPEYIYIYKCNIIDERVLNTVYPSIDSTTLLTKYGSLVDGVMVLTEDDFIYFMNNIKTDTYLSTSSKIAIAGYHYFIDYNYVMNLIPKPQVSILIEYGFIDNYEKKQLAQSKLEYIVETHHEVVLDINNSDLSDSLNDISGLIKDIYVFSRKKVNLNGISKYGKSEYTVFTNNNIDSIQLNIANEYNLFEYYTVDNYTFNNVQSYIMNSPPPNGVWYKTYSLNPYNIQPNGFINLNNIIGQNIMVSVNNNNLYYYTSKNNPYNLGTEFKILYTKYNIINVKDGNINLTFYS